MVVRVYLVSQQRINLRQPFSERIATVIGQIALDGGAEFPIGLRTEKQPAYEALQIKRRSATHQHSFASSTNIFGNCVRS